MKLTGSSRVIETRKIVIFGAGRIGRSFIGQLFSRAGYKTVFIDINTDIINLLNSRKEYSIKIKGEEEEEIIISDVEAIRADDTDSAAEAVATAGILAVSVGKNAIEKVMPLIAEGLLRRYSFYPETPLDLILAENMRSAAEFTRDQLLKYLPEGFPVDSYVGLIETSIGKMVPIMPISVMERDPLTVFAEPYNTLILDGKGFRSSVPDVKGLAPKSNIKAWVDRKAFIHNLGHATAAYCGHYYYPHAVYMYEVLEESNILNFTRNVMVQAARILRSVYPEDFTMTDLEEHIDDLLYRFRNKALLDTIFRVGQDIPRKLSADDRFMGSIHLAMKYSRPYDLIIKAMSYGFFFRAKDEEGKPFPADEQFLQTVAENFEFSLTGILKLDPESDRKVMETLKREYEKLGKNV